MFGSSSTDAWGGGARKAPDNELDITPMIDVTFLLLIFFMVTSTMQEPDLDVPSAAHGQGIDARGGIVVQIKEGTPPALVIDGQGVALDEVRGRVEEAVREHRPEVIIRADGQIPYGFVQQIARIVTEVEGAEFSIGVRDKESR
jgi:biopolymer transport protein ExbD